MNKSNIKQIVGKSYYLLFVFVLFSFTACKDKSYIETIYNKALLDKHISCLKLDIEPYSQTIYNTTSKLYNFTNNCKNKLTIRYKSNIVCNSPYSTNRSFHSFVELSLTIDNHLTYSIYKDLKNNKQIEQTIKTIYDNYIVEHIKN